MELTELTKHTNNRDVIAINKFNMIELKVTRR